MTIEKLELTEPEKKLDAFGHVDNIHVIDWYQKSPTRYDLHRAELKINEIVDAVNDIQKAQVEHIKEFKDHRHLQGLTCSERDKLIKKLDYIELWIENHEKNILPRFKEELLKCLEDDEFRIKLKERLGYNPVKHTWEEPSLAYKATAINRMQSESSEFPNLKLKEAEDELELELNLFDGVLVESDIPQEKINPLRRAFENWKEARSEDR